MTVNFVVDELCKRVYDLQAKKAGKKRDAAIRSEKAKVYEKIQPFLIGRFKMDPRHVQFPPEEVANKDFYLPQKDKIKEEMIVKGPAFKCGDNLLCFLKVCHSLY